MRDRGRPGIAQQPGKRNVRKLGRAVCDRREEREKRTQIPRRAEGSSREAAERDSGRRAAGGGERRVRGREAGGGTGVRPTHLSCHAAGRGPPVPGSLRAGARGQAGSAAALAQDGSGARLRRHQPRLWRFLLAGSEDSPRGRVWPASPAGLGPRLPAPQAVGEGK